MDIIISAEQGAGKTTLALGIIKTYLGAKNVGDIINDIFKVKFIGDEVTALTATLREAKPQAILFDSGVILSPAELLIAVEAVKRYRAQTGRPRTLAIYVEQHPNVIVVLDSKVSDRRCYPGNVLNREPVAVGTWNLPTTKYEVVHNSNLQKDRALLDKHLLHLWNYAMLKATLEDMRLMLSKLKEFIPDIEAPDFPGCTLRVDQCYELHAFLLDLKRKQDER